MLNQEIYLDPPQQRKLENQGVANVNDDTRDQNALQVLKYELKTFVCDGQYEKGIHDILDTYLKNINKPEQPGVWVSGFFGSGKSHMVKMLRALWLNTEFPDGVAARDLANLPQSIKDHLVDLSNAGKREGGLHAASGTLGSSASGSVRLALLQIVFKSVDLPTQYPVAQFVMWLRDEGILDRVRSAVESKGYDWQEELDNFYVAEGLHEALVQEKPNLFSSPQMCVETLNNKYPHVTDVSNAQMIKSIRDALTRAGKFPLTLIVLDEVQQYIGSNSDRSIQVQEMVESCCKQIGGKLMIVATGQTAVTGTSNLKKLEGRFTTRIELSDADVEGVIRKVILAKKPGAIKTIESKLETNLGEISRQLEGTSLSHRQDDKNVFAADYPILPVRRRFWEEALRVLDQTGTDSQLRNQLSMAHKVIQTNLDQPVPHVIAADYLYFDSADKLLQARMLPRKVYEQTMQWSKGSDDQKLLARACGLVFLVSKVASGNEELGIRATSDTIADLMVEDLDAGSKDLRAKLPALMSKCDLLMKVGDEYRIQTEESAAWTDEFMSQRNQLGNETHRIETERDDRIRSRFGEIAGKKTLVHGQSKVSRTLYTCFDSKLPSDADKHVTIWVRDQWSTELNSVQIDARQAGNHSPTVFVFIPKRSADELRHHLIDSKAATATLSARGENPTSPEGIEACSAMKTTRDAAQEKIRQLLDESFGGARVMQGGGSEVLGNNLQEMILEAAENSLARLYQKFPIADAVGWDKVYKKAKEGAPDALKAVGHDGDVDKHPVCKEIISYIAAGKKGSDIRSHFEEAPYGWDRDAIDGGLQALLISGLIRAQDEKGGLVDPRELERKAIGKAVFKIESATVSATQRIQIRKRFQRLKLTVKSGEELSAVPEFITRLTKLANSAGGDAPMPATPDRSAIEEIRLASGNEQLLVIYNRRDDLEQSIDDWEAIAKKIGERWPVWQQLQSLLTHAGNVKAADEARQQAGAITDQRLLLADPDPISPMVKSVEDTLRSELTSKHQAFCDRLKKREESLQSDESWAQLSQEQQASIRSQCNIEPIAAMQVSSQEELIAALKSYPISSWSDRIEALSGRFARARELAAKELEPETQSIEIPRRTFNKDDVDAVAAWLDEVGALLNDAVADGPVVIK
ncbi:BREX system P-loop protein BrxC [Stieleria sp. ICT_E10.1]|uniref:BREX system P-loop protein BrxC n=1 Tax=Stieleria sedimenti TaxID=2976331 RepID=UPI00218068C2|nr:BREX system P-loop protein BrxC [Stieleria sedimenti]MCS7466131.1 BREX system P-loop protein BrxC [Stieleria sedimenti]